MSGSGVYRQACEGDEDDPGCGWREREVPMGGKYAYSDNGRCPKCRRELPVRDRGRFRTQFDSIFGIEDDR